MSLNESSPICLCPESGERCVSSLIREIHIERAKVRFILACTFGAFLWFPYQLCFYSKRVMPWDYVVIGANKGDFNSELNMVS